MKTLISFFKNSNTGQLIMRQRFTETKIIISDYFYDDNLISIPEPNMKGFVEIKKKTFDRERRKNKAI